MKNAEEKILTGRKNGMYVNLLTDIPVLLSQTLLMFALAVWRFGRRLKRR